MIDDLLAIVTGFWIGAGITAIYLEIKERNKK